MLFSKSSIESIVKYKSVCLKVKKYIQTGCIRCYFYTTLKSCDNIACNANQRKDNEYVYFKEQ